MYVNAIMLARTSLAALQTAAAAASQECTGME